MGNKYLPMLIADPIDKFSTFQHIVLQLYDQKKCKILVTNIYFHYFVILPIADMKILANGANIR